MLARSIDLQLQDHLKKSVLPEHPHKLERIQICIISKKISIISQKIFEYVYRKHLKIVLFQLEPVSSS